MEFTRLIGFILGLGLSVGLALVAWLGFSRGSIKPFRMGRWSEPEEVRREASPGEFWQWLLVYTALSFGALVVSVLALIGKMKFR